jgi:protein gp37
MTKPQELNMGKSSYIQWTHHTYNPWIGCTKVSPGCIHCFAEKCDKLRGYTDDGWGPGKPRHRTKTHADVMKWNKALENTGRRERLFCASLGDIMDDEIDPSWRSDLWTLIESTPNLDWLLLTKRPQNYAKFLPRSWFLDGFPPNVWIGTTAENQEYADLRMPLLIQIPAVVRFVSAEPLISNIDFSPWISQLDWIIVGGESGHHFRTMNPEWATNIRDQCQAHDVAFFFKQWSGIHPGKLGNELEGVAHQCYPQPKLHRVLAESI